MIAETVSFCISEWTPTCDSPASDYGVLGSLACAATASGPFPCHSGNRNGPWSMRVSCTVLCEQMWFLSSKWKLLIKVFWKFPEITEEYRPSAAPRFSSDCSSIVVIHDYKVDSPDLPREQHAQTWLWIC